jgi:ABC-type bacteriocin/lantibiotic exporter with double-glycine peptidase domain
MIDTNVMLHTVCTIIDNTVFFIATHSTYTNSLLLYVHCYTITGENSTGALTTRLEEDANIMAQATGLELGHKVHIAMTLIIGIIIGLIVAWQVGLVAMAVVPLIGKCT